MASKIRNKAVCDFTEIPVDVREEFEYVAAYLVDTYYNKLVTTAEEYLAAKMKPTLTECYRLAITNFLVAFRDATNAHRILGQFHEYYSNVSGKPLNYEECVFKIVLSSIPEEFYVAMDRQQKTTILIQIWVSAIQSMTDLIYRDYITLILDNRDQQSYAQTATQQMQDEMINILAISRESLYGQFYTHTHVPVANQQMTAHMSSKMKVSIQKLVEEKTELRSKMQSLEKVVYKIHTDNGELQEKVETLQNENAELLVRIKTMDIMIRGYRRSIGEDENAPLPLIAAAVAANPKQSKRKNTTPTVITSDLPSVRGGKQKSSAYTNFLNPSHFDRDVNERLADVAHQTKTKATKSKVRKIPEEKHDDSDDELGISDDEDDDGDGDEDGNGDDDMMSLNVGDTSLEDDIKALEKARNNNTVPSQKQQQQQQQQQQQRSQQQQQQQQQQQRSQQQSSPYVAQTVKLSDAASDKSDIPSIDFYK